MSGVDIFNVYDFVTYEYNLTKCEMFVKWDKNNEAVNAVMMKEGYQSYNEKLGFSWIDKLKEITNWVDGDIINIITSFPYNGKIHIAWEFNRTLSSRHIVILGDGYFYKRDYNQHYCPLVKVNCLHNDLMDDMIPTYVLK